MKGAYNGGMMRSAERAALSFVGAINRHDVERMAALMTSGHRMVDSMAQEVKGRDAVRACWVGYFHMVPDYSIAVEETFCDGPVVVMLGVAKGTYAPEAWLKVENRWETPVALRATIKDGKVAEWRVYADNEPMRERMRAAV